MLRRKSMNAKKNKVFLFHLSSPLHIADCILQLRSSTAEEDKEKVIKIHNNSEDVANRYSRKPQFQEWYLFTLVVCRNSTIPLIFMLIQIAPNSTTTNDNYTNTLVMIVTI